MQRVQRLPAPGRLDGFLVAALRGIRASEVNEHICQPPAQCFPLEELPFVKFWAVWQVESGHKPICSQRSRRFEGQQAARAGDRRLAACLEMSMLLCLAQAAVKLEEVYPDVRLGLHLDFLALDAQHILAERFF